ncbi:hypothetical protein [Streptomyces sp. NPDC088789]|uniref:hypothetical protein n=1 Tax=Streptomyces sp. NPDC088789 TaxID=3365899 RepID=UPI0038150F0A
MRVPTASFRRRLLIVLAADAEVQVAWLARHGVATDEIALDFDHAFRMAEPLVAEGRLASVVRAGLREIDVVLSGMSEGEHADRWARDGLFTDEAWVRARCVGRQVLLPELGAWPRILPEITVIR